MLERVRAKGRDRFLPLLSDKNHSKLGKSVRFKILFCNNQQKAQIIWKVEFKFAFINVSRSSVNKFEWQKLRNREESFGPCYWLNECAVFGFYFRFLSNSYGIIVWRVAVEVCKTQHCQPNISLFLILYSSVLSSCKRVPSIMSCLFGNGDTNTVDDRQWQLPSTV